MEIDTKGFALGERVRDTVSGLTGIITGVHQYQAGCARVTIQPPVGADGKVPDGYGQDVVLVELVEGVAETRRRAAAPVHIGPGGPRNDPHSRV